MSKRLSIIVPVYNVEKYLDECLHSLVCQDISDYEIIVVNDGSTDNSQKVIDRYVKEYPDIVRSYIKENGGLSDARNHGLQYASGNYITFIDSDDYVSEDYYRIMLEKAENEDLDLVVADMEYFWEDGSRPNFRQRGLNSKVTDKDKALFLSSLSVCNKLFRRELFESLGLRFYKGLWYDDIPVTLMYFANIRSYAYCPEPRYMYRQRKGSILGTGYSPKMNDIFTIFDRVKESFRSKGLFDRYRDELEYLHIEHFLLYGAFRFLRSDHYKELMPKTYDYVKKDFPEYKKNKYIRTLGIKNRLFLILNNKATETFWHWCLTR